jgi:ATP-dependent RNA helicase RhlE
MSHSTFETLGLSTSTLRALQTAHFTQPTPIQVQAIPLALAGKDVIGCAATGTGKTAAFLLPLMERIEGKAGTRALVLAPTRELALQIHEQLRLFAQNQKITSAVIIGGVATQGQVHALRQRPNVIIATPGRLVDHLQQGTAQLGEIEILVLDEADRMLDMGFKPQLTRILAKLPRQRQTLLFSATMAQEVTDFAKSHLKHPTPVEVSRSGTTAKRAEQSVFLATEKEKGPLLLALLSQHEGSVLVFTRTKRRADKVSKVLERQGHKVARIHADRSQAQRRHALDGFKGGQYRILVATDIAARGIDVEEIGTVVNYDLPFVPEDYVHRIGRTARAAASGIACSFCAPDEKELLIAIEKFTRGLIPRAEVPRNSPEFVAEAERLRTAETNPGPRQPNHGRSSRPPGQAAGRHARTHHGRNRPRPANAQRA